MEQIHHWINNQPQPGASGNTDPVFNPATGRQIAEVALASADEVDQAVASAARAFEDWRETSVAQRMAILFRFRELVASNRDKLALLLTREHGKVLADAQGEISRGLENIEYACGAGELLKGDYTEQASRGIDVYSIRQPLGVVAGISPFNFPAMVPLWMYPNAIACGNTFVLKPSEKDPSAPLFTMELLAEAGLPPGVVNLVHGNKLAVDRLLEHPEVAAVSFVGSTPVAQQVYETATRNGKRAQALGGAKNHQVVLPDADLAGAADAAVSAAYGSSGERCMAISAVVAVGGVGDQLVPAIAERLEKIKVGAGDDPDSEMGPLISAAHRQRVQGYIDSARDQGAAVVRDGSQDEIAGGDGFFLGATLLDEVTPEMDCYRDEIFGPVLSVLRVDSYHDAVQLINQNPWGNGAAIFTRDGGAARQFQFDVQAGMVGINVPIPVPVAYYSFGGWNGSLFGDTHIYGPEGVHFYTQAKVVSSRWPDPATSAIDLGFPQTH